MDWFSWTTILANVGGTAALLLIAAWLGRKWIGTRIEESVRHEYNKLLAEHQASLDANAKRRDQEWAEKSVKAEQELVADQKLFERLLEEIPSDGSIAFLESHAFDGIFSRRRLDQVQAFHAGWKDPEHEFFDEAMERHRTHLHECIGDFLTYSATNTWATNTEGWQAVPSEWRESQPNRFADTVKALNSLADKVVQAHRDLIRDGRRLLRL